MEDIYLDKKIDNDLIKGILESLFPDLIIFYWDFIDESPAGFGSENDDHIVFNTSFHDDKKEFGFVISVYRTPKEDSQERALLLGKKISVEFNIRVLVPFVHPEDIGYPYYDIIFNKGHSSLADDSDTNFADGTEGLVKVIGDFNLPDLSFDRKAKKVSGK